MLRRSNVNHRMKSRTNQLVLFTVKLEMLFSLYAILQLSEY